MMLIRGHRLLIHFFLSVFFAASLILSGCSSNNIKGKTEAESLYLQAKKAYEKKRYLEATEKLGLLRSQHPYSYYTTSAELLMADIYFAQENYLEAAASYQQFRDLHPKHEQIAYVIFQQAESLFLQIPSTNDRDLSNGEESLKFYGEIVTLYGSSPYSSTAKDRIKEISARLVEKDLYILRFYFKTGEFEASNWRASYLIEKYRNNQAVLKKIWPSKVTSLLKLKKYDQCLEDAKTAAMEIGDGPDIEVISKIVNQCANEAKNFKEG